jgi:hypothetical protein
MKWKNPKKLKENSPQYTNIIAIDPSTTSTGICINGKMVSVFRETSSSITTKGAYKKWFKLVDDEIDVISVEDRIKKNNYSEEEISKLEMYRTFAGIVSDTINSHISDPKDSIVLIEGYSYSSEAGHLIDLVTFSTLIREFLYSKGYNIKVVAPSSLKMWTAKFSYEPTKEPLNKAKTRFKTSWRSPHTDNAGGKFTKSDMFNAIIDNDKLSDSWKEFLKVYYDELSEKAKIPSPIEDLNDAYLLYNIHKNGYDE